jgi:hypothetical protein
LKVEIVRIGADDRLVTGKVVHRQNEIEADSAAAGQPVLDGVTALDAAARMTYIWTAAQP